MKQTGKNLLPRLLALVLAFSLLPVQVLSAAVCLPGEPGARVIQDSEHPQKKETPQTTESAFSDTSDASEAQTEPKEKEITPADATASGKKAETDGEKSTEAADTETDSIRETVPEPEGTESSSEHETSANTEKSESSSYQLNITHRLRFYVDGSAKQLDEKEILKLTADDFKNGSYDLTQHIFHREELSAQIQGGPQLNIKSFKEDTTGIPYYNILIVYTVKNGYKAVLKDDAAGSSNLRPRSVYQGRFETVQFIPAKSITLTIQYLYSTTGGMAGVKAADTDKIELFPDANGRASLKNWPVPHYVPGSGNAGSKNPNLNGFRVVLNPSPLNQFLAVPPTGKETPEQIQEALSRGDYNLKEGVDTDSQEYQNAWAQARRLSVNGADFSYTAPAVYGGPAGDENAYTLSVSGLTQDMTVTVYYRRDASSYTVRHLIPKDDAANPDTSVNDDWQVYQNNGTVYEFTEQGRVGAMTKAKSIDITGYKVVHFSQVPIAADNSTVVNIYYMPESIRVIFYTDDVYIDRQQVPVGQYVDFSNFYDEAAYKTANSLSADKAIKNGYRLTGWQYQIKGSNPAEYADVPLDGSHKLQLTKSFIDNAELVSSVEAQDILVLRFVPKWEKITTPIRVVFWTENLNGQDVRVTDTALDGTKERSGEIVHQNPNIDSSYSNIGSFTLDNMFETGESLVDSSGRLVPKLQTQIDSQFIQQMGTVPDSTISDIAGYENPMKISDFYEPCKENPYTILVESVQGGNISEDTTQTTAAANGSTLVYVYYTRKVYTLDFIYYFPSSTAGGDASHVRASSNTEWFISNWSNFPAENPGGWYDIPTENLEDVPMTKTIEAKYGANLLGIWPEDPETLHTGSEATLRVSWTTTAGLHNAYGRKGQNNGCIPGSYASMGASVIANPKNPAIKHSLIAFWKASFNSYRYNYCYEVPELTQSQLGTAVKIYNGEPKDTTMSPEEQLRRNTLYLVPQDNPVFRKYGFTDLLEVNYTNGQIIYPDDTGYNPSGNLYYAIRVYNNGYYAVARRANAVAAMRIHAQSASVRPHLTVVNARADHSSELTDDDPPSGAGYNILENPYDIYFYYTRDRYTITYLSDETTEIGQIELPYGTTLSKKYAFDLNYKKKNGDYVQSEANPDGWSLLIKDAGDTTGKQVSPNLPVCSKRSADGTKIWLFKGWALGPAGTRMMQWEDDARGLTRILDSNLLLYSSWMVPTYKVTFDFAGGTLIPGNNAPVNQYISANQSFVSSGQIPRLTRAGHVLDGWVITQRGTADGTMADENANTPFKFDQPVTSDLQVKAVWEPTSEVSIQYTIRYLVKDTEIKVRDDKKMSGLFLSGTTVWEDAAPPTVAAYLDYIPIEQKASVKLDSVHQDKNVITFYYAAPGMGQYTVEFINYETKSQPSSQPVYVRIESGAADQSAVYPTHADFQALSQRGYRLVDETGKDVADASHLQSLERIEGKESIFTFYVKPIVYTITYLGVEDYLSAGNKLDNKAVYTVTSPDFKVVNPARYTKDGKTYEFLGWSLGSGTKEATGKTSQISKDIVVETGSTGHLVFVANWNPAVYTVTFKPGKHGSLSGKKKFEGINEGAVVSESGITVPKVKPKTGYRFVGWSYSGDSGKLYSSTKILDMKVTHHMVFTAQYKTAKSSGGNKKPKDTEKPTGTEKPKETDKNKTPTTSGASKNPVFAGVKSSAASRSPETGDGTELIFWMLLCAGSLLGTSILLASRKRKTV